MSLGSFEQGETVRIPLHFLIDGYSAEITSPQVEKIIGPDGYGVSGFPANMTQIGGHYVYYYDYKVSDVGNYIVVMNGTVGALNREVVETFYVRAPLGFPRLQIGG